MPTDLDTRVERIQPSDGLPLDAAPPSEFGLALAVHRADTSVRSHFDRAIDVSAVPTDSPIAAIVRTPVLASPDVLTVISAERSGSEVWVVLELRQFTGDLFGNIATVGLVLASIGLLEVGSYEFCAETHTLPFDDAEHPEAVSESSVQTLRLPFRVR